MYVTAGVPGTGGRLKVRPEDFLVEELPAYQPSGDGEHVYLFVEKRGLPTLTMLGAIARHFGVRTGDVGYAGLKDKHAITRQMVSVHLPGVDENSFGAFEHPHIGILWAARHGNKLRRGHLAGNRFIIRIRDVDVSKVVHAHRAIGLLAKVGVPNRAGEQRFGSMRNNHLIGRAIVLGRWREALDCLLGPGAEPGGGPAATAEARHHYARGEYAQARAALPMRFHAERRALAALEKGTGPKRAVENVGDMQRRFYLTAFQSAVFNHVLEARLEAGTLGRLGAGDLAFRHDNGSVFAVGEQEAESPELAERLARLQISPSGPMWGDNLTRAAGAVDAAEVAALEQTGVSVDALRAYASRHRGDIEGARKPLRVPLSLPDVEGGLDEHGAYIRCAFELPRGAFATVVMREVMKPAGALEPHEDGEPE